MSLEQHIVYLMLLVPLSYLLGLGLGFFWGRSKS